MIDFSWQLLWNSIVSTLTSKLSEAFLFFMTSQSSVISDILKSLSFRVHKEDFFLLFDFSSFFLNLLPAFFSSFTSPLNCFLPPFHLLLPFPHFSSFSFRKWCFQAKIWALFMFISIGVVENDFNCVEVCYICLCCICLWM